ncbi:NAD(P)/FAD-dependent oxidoreductase [Massilia sp. METH4]|uniref:NAD(P)/FAD-dependent oxidoreductase n=1 Tax=Massilia sp. METH4 TaxID=3123041 RepID=UPI0030D28193
MQTIVIAGGGVAGLELATRLGRDLGRRNKARIVLVDSAPTHFWKPLLHSVAAGTIDPSHYHVDLARQAIDNHFEFLCGEVVDIDRAGRTLKIRARLPHALGHESVLRYDRLVLSFGSVTNFFGVPGAETHCLSLDGVEQAEAFRRRFLRLCAATSGGAPRVNIVIVGAGPTGVELAADLRHTVDTLVRYRLNSLESPCQVRITIIERGPRLLPTLAPALSEAAARKLRELGIEIRTNTAVSAVTAEHVTTADGEVFPAAIAVWAAGVQGPAINTRLGIALNRNKQVLVDEQLRAVDDPFIHAMGDCSAMQVSDSTAMVPPSAQAARQQAIFLHRLLAGIERAAIPVFRYRDQGTLVSLGEYGAVGMLRQVIGDRYLNVQGAMAKAAYRVGYERYVMANLGPVRMFAQMLVRWARSRWLMPVKWH